MLNFLRVRRIGSFFLLVIFFSASVEAQNSKSTNDVYYMGGYSQLEIDFHKKMNFDINKGKYREYYLIFKIEINKLGGIGSIVTLNHKKDEITQSIYSTLLKTSENWRNGSSKNQTIILPIFIIGEENKGNIDKTSNNSEYDYSEIKGTLLKPLVIPQYKEST
jgi:hypothetical protein